MAKKTDKLIRFDGAEHLIPTIQNLAEQNKRSFNSQVLILLEYAVKGKSDPPISNSQFAELKQLIIRELQGQKGMMTDAAGGKKTRGH